MRKFPRLINVLPHLTKSPAYFQKTYFRRFSAFRASNLQMGCCWIGLEKAMVGYPLEFRDVFAGTELGDFDILDSLTYYQHEEPDIDVDKLNMSPASDDEEDNTDDEEDDEEDDKERISPFKMLQTAWFEFVALHHPHLKDMKIKPHLGATSLPAEYDVEYHTYECSVVFGHELTKPRLVKSSDENGADPLQYSEPFLFPKNFPAIIKEFVSYFRTKYVVRKTNIKFQEIKINDDPQYCVLVTVVG